MGFLGLIYIRKKGCWSSGFLDGLCGKTHKSEKGTVAAKTIQMLDVSLLPSLDPAFHVIMVCGELGNLK